MIIQKSAVQLTWSSSYIINFTNQKPTSTHGLASKKKSWTTLNTPIKMDINQKGTQSFCYILMSLTC